MQQFQDSLQDRQQVKLRVSGSQSIPQFVSGSGFWASGGKATRALIHLVLGAQGLECRVPHDYPNARIRLGQHNLTSLGSPAVPAFTLMAAAPEGSSWKLLNTVSWLIAFRLSSEAVANMSAAFAEMSQSSIGFHLDPKNGALTAHTRTQDVPCPYLFGGLLLNHAPEQSIGFEELTYADATDAIRGIINIDPLPSTADLGEQ